MTDQTNYTSKVPYFTFPKTLEKQKAALKSNPLLMRLINYRKRYFYDPHRPIYHYVNPENILNDPNGLCYWQGRWHLFYQGYPPEDPRQHWGHAVSDDLIHWLDLPYAIYPNPERCCFSGTTLVEDNRVIAMYHGTEVGNMVAISNDPLLLNWEKITGQAVIPIQSPDGSLLPYNVFDPCIWEKDGFYFALSAGTLPHEPSGKRRRANFLFRSTDLANWEYLHPFVEGDVFTLIGDDGACPYFWPIGGRHILLFFSHMSGGQALLGDYDKDRDIFVVTAHIDANFGAFGPGGVYAPSATPDDKGGVIVIYNMNSAKPTKGWDQIMSLPRRLTLQGTDKLGCDALFVVPAGDVESLRDEYQNIPAMTLPANKEIVLDRVQGNSIELIAEFAPSDASMIELNVLRSSNKEEFTSIAFYKTRGYRNRERYSAWERDKLLEATDSLITIDNSYSSTASDVWSRAPETGPVYVGPNEPLVLRVFIDKSIVEVFVNNKQCVAVRVYPERKDSVGISLRAQGKKVTLKSMDVWQMKNIYQ